MKLLINYADELFQASREINCKTGTDVAGFNKVISYSPQDIDKYFYHKHKKLLKQFRGNGYWVWKPYFIKKSLELLDEGDVLFYCDSGVIFLSSIQPVIDFALQTGQKVVPFELEYAMEKIWTKRDAFILMDCDTSEYTDTPQCLASYHCWIQSKFAMDFVEEWLYYIQDERITTDIPNQLGEPNYPGFVEHRHDQSIFSLLAKQHGLKACGSKIGQGIFFIHRVRNTLPLKFLAKVFLARVKRRVKKFFGRI